MNNQTLNQSTSNFRKIIISIFLCLMILVAVITNPEKEIHKSKIKRSLHTDMDTELLSAVLDDKILERMVEVNNYVLFSITNIGYLKEKKVVGIGTFGNVFLLTQDSSFIRDSLFTGAPYNKVSNQGAAIANLMTLKTSEKFYMIKYETYTNLQGLFEEGFIDSKLASGIKQWYRYSTSGTVDKNNFAFTADPVNSLTGTLHFFVDQTGVMRYSLFGTATKHSDPID